MAPIDCVANSVLLDFLLKIVFSPVKKFNLVKFDIFYQGPLQLFHFVELLYCHAVCTRSTANLFITTKMIDCYSNRPLTPPGKLIN